LHGGLVKAQAEFENFLIKADFKVAA
jgi:hypothetical protein